MRASTHMLVALAIVLALSVPPKPAREHVVGRDGDLAW